MEASIISNQYSNDLYKDIIDSNKQKLINSVDFNIDENINNKDNNKLLNKINSNTIYSWGFSKYGQTGKLFTNYNIIPNKIDFQHFNDNIQNQSNKKKSHSILELYAGECHSIIYNEITNNLSVFGKNIFGQLGLFGNNNKYITYPIINNILNNKIKIDKISCGGEHTLLLTNEKIVITFGLNVFGQLGNGTNTTNEDYTVLNFNDKNNIIYDNLLIKNEYITDIAAGAQHSCLLSSENRIFTCGFPNSKALARDIENNIDESYYFKKIDFDLNINNNNFNKVIKLIAGYYHSGVLLDNNSFYIWGCGEVLVYNQPHLFNENNFNILQDEAFNILDLKIGIDIILVRTVQSKIYMIGDNSKCQINNNNNSSSSCSINYDNKNINNTNNINGCKENNSTNNKNNIFSNIDMSNAIFNYLIQLIKKDNNNNNNNNIINNKISILKKSEILFKIVDCDVGYEHVICIIVINTNCIENIISINENVNQTITIGWGSNEFGQLANEEHIYINKPFVINSLNNITKIKCGGYHNLAILKDNESIDNFKYIQNCAIKYNLNNNLNKSFNNNKKQNTNNNININNSDYEDTSSNVFKLENNHINKGIVHRRNLSMEDIRHCINKNFSVLKPEEELKNMLLQIPLSSTLKNDNNFINQKNKLIANLNKKSIELNNIRKKNEKLIDELRKQEKDLLNQILIAKESENSLLENDKINNNNKSLSRGFSNDFEISTNEIKKISNIGNGTFGDVFLAKWRKELVALKVLKKEMLNQEDTINSFHEECCFLKNLRHPNILLFMGANTKGPDYFILTELCDRGTLFDLLHDNKNKHIVITWKEKKRIALEICYGMNYLHSFKPPILHRDLKSMNVLVNKYFQVKLADFGNTKFLENHMTKQKGTFQWMAPEVILNTKYTEKADVFSFGIIMSELMTRIPPYYGVDKREVATKVANSSSFRPKILKDCPKDWALLMQRCWDHNPVKRPNFNEIIEILINAKL